MLESLQRARGARVGCYTSPHILLYNERIRIDGIDASDQQIVSAFERIEEVREGEELTYFEFGTLAALIVFADAGVDTQVLEIGMGGRLDAVNAVEPTAGLITNVGLDHCAWLGEDVETIAFEKAGIMRPGKIAVFGSHDVPKSVTDHAATIGARLLTAGRDGTSTGMSLPIPGRGRAGRSRWTNCGCRRWSGNTRWRMRPAYWRCWKPAA